MVLGFIAGLSQVPLTFTYSKYEELVNIARTLGRQGQWLRALLSALSRDPGLISSNHMTVHNCLIPAPGNMTSFSGLLRHCILVAQRHTCT